MSISEYNVNILKKCGNCKDFKLYDETGIIGYCISDTTKIKQKSNRSMMSKCCSSQRRIK